MKKKIFYSQYYTLYYLCNSKRNFTTSNPMFADLNKVSKILERATAFHKEMEEYKKQLDQSKLLDIARKQAEKASERGCAADTSSSQSSEKSPFQSHPESQNSKLAEGVVPSDSQETSNFVNDNLIKMIE